jgi:bla regulator protein BlaR1
MRYVLWVCYLFSIVFIAIYTTASPEFSIPFLQISPHRVKENLILSNLLFPQNDVLSTANNHTIRYSVYIQEELKLSTESLHWYFWILCGWITGTILSLLYTLTGRIGVSYISKSTSRYSEQHFIEEVSQLARELGIKREVRVVVSSRCRLPFTYNFIHPTLVIPDESKNWPKKKRRAILIHELSHIRRHDFLILILSRVICSVFWFIPVTWIAHADMQLEQEKICDSISVEEGERPAEYARYMVDLARTARSLVLWSGIFIMKRRNNMLEKRVINVLETKQEPIDKKAHHSKVRFLSLMIIFAATIMVASLATGKKIISRYDAITQFQGVYVNSEYSGHVESYPQKRIIYPDGRMEVYFKATNQSPNFTNRYTIDESWSDSAEIVYSTVIVEWTPTGNTTRELWKLDKKNNTFEVNFNSYSLYEDVSQEYPEKIDPHAEQFPTSIYSIWYRQ